MSDYQLLYLLAALLYLWECVIRVRRTEWVFVRRMRCWRAFSGDGLSGGAGIILAWPLPMLGRVFLAGEGLADEDRDARFDLSGARRLEGELRAATRALYVLCCAQWFILFIFSPLAVLGLGGAGLVWAMAALVGLNLCIVWLYYRAHGRFFGGMRAERATEALKMLLCPPVSIRAMDFLSLRLLARYHPLVVGRLVLSGDGFHALARAVYFRALAKDEQAASVLAGFLMEQGLPASGFFEPPRRMYGALCWCPACLSQYTIPHDACPDCGFDAVASWLDAGSDRCVGAGKP